MIAEHLHKTVDELLYGPYPLSIPEFNHWLARMKMQQEEEKKAQKEASRSKGKAGMGGKNVTARFQRDED